MLSRLLLLLVVDMLAIGLALHLGEPASRMLECAKNSVKPRRLP